MNQEANQFKAKKKGSKSSYSAISFDAVVQIAKKFKLPSYVAAYLTIARHTDKDAHGEFGENRVSCAGGLKVSKVAGISQITAKQRLMQLANHGFLQKAPKGLKVKGKQAEWIIPATHILDTNLPHQLFDEFETAQGIGIPLKRIFDDKNRTPEVKLAALVMLIYFYNKHDLLNQGGVPRDIFFRKLEDDGGETATLDADGLYRWECVPKQNIFTTGNFQRLFLQLLGYEYKEELCQSIFWPAYRVLNETGFLIETVMLYVEQKPYLVIRFNDLHTSQQLKSWLGEQEADGLGFYYNPKSSLVQDNELSEQFYVKLPTDVNPIEYMMEQPPIKRGQPKPVPQRFFEMRYQYWLRFRCSDPTTGMAIEKFNSLLESLKSMAIDIVNENTDDI